jgi:HD-GYP domain-containing protein (c-di-GMP phosphodiesterase class II)
VAVPLLQTAIVRGAIEIESEQLDFFTSSDVALVEQMAAELVGAWARSSYRSRLMELIQAGISLSTMVEPDATVQEIARIAERTLEARFTYVSLLFDQEEKLVVKAHRGHAPRLLRALEADTGRDSLMKASLNAAQPFRIRDVRKYSSSTAMELDDHALHSLLAVPIRLHGFNIGAILAFGKLQEACFSESDESLASLLASQAAAAIESVWLQQELRTTLGTTRLLYELSHHIIQAGELSEAARHIAAAAHRLVQANRTGIVLFKPDGTAATRIEVDGNGPHSGGSHPMQTIEEVLQTGRMVYESLEHNLSRICLPIQTPARKHGVLWLNVPEERGYKSGTPADLQTLTNQAALALERLILMVESRQQALEIEDAFHELELAYDRTLAGLISTLDARDRETEGHSTRVSLLTVRLGSALGLQGQQLKALERGALLHDIGKIGISDEILHKPGPLTETEWRQMRLHPRIGARIIEGIPFLEDSLPVILSHHERWDGSGYPQGRKGQEIPWLARIFAVVDAFDALTSDRPYRSRIAMQDALSYLRGQAGTLFDPHIVEQFVQLVTESSIDPIMPGKSR